MGNWFQSSSLEPSPLLKQHGPRGIGGWAVCQVQPSQVEAGTKVMTLPETNIFAPENGWVGIRYSFLFWEGLFSGGYVSLREGTKAYFC